MKSPTALLLSTLVSAAAFAAAPEAPAEANRYLKDGVAVDFSIASLRPRFPVMEDELAEVRFAIRDANGQPLRGLAPGAWLDMAQNIRNQEREGAEQKSCKDKIALYLKGVVGIRPLLDLNSYYVVVMNRDNSLSVIDPKVSMAGRTSTLARIDLPGAGADWTRSSDEKRLFVTLPAAGKVAVVDVDTFRVAATADAGAVPTRAVLQPDGRYVWVGNNAGEPERSGVTLIDADTLQPVTFIRTGRGHHEIAVSGDSQWVFVTNREDGTVSVIDARRQKLVRELKVGTQPISLAWSQLSKRLYVADARGSGVHVIRPDDQAEVAVIKAPAGLGPMRFTPDGRWAMLLNTVDNQVLVIDPATNTVVHRIDVPEAPYQIDYTRAFAYVRSLGSERVTMINLSSIGGGKNPIVQSFAAGSLPPKKATDVALANAIAPAAGDAGVLVVNPADNTTYFYMEGMNAAASNYQVYGSAARAVTVVDRSLREVEPGVYATKVKLPAAGRYDVAFSLDSPRMLHCFAADVDANPRLAQNRQGTGIRWLAEQRSAPAGSKVPVRFRLDDLGSGKPRAGLTDVRVMWLLAPGRLRQETAATEVSPGVYEAVVTLSDSGAWYVHAASQTLGKGYRELPYTTLVSTPPTSTARGAPQAEGAR